MLALVERMLALHRKLAAVTMSRRKRELLKEYRAYKANAAR